MMFCTVVFVVGYICGVYGHSYVKQQYEKYKTKVTNYMRK